MDAASCQECAPEVSDDLVAGFPNLRGLGCLSTPAAEWASCELSQLPPQAKHGTLKNGLRWIVQENREPKSRAELYLVVGFGSLVEEEAERGIAHIIEHLGFSATKSYENHAIVKFLESIGAPFGACQNAYTSFDRTVYTLHVPTDKAGLVDESLTVLREFAYFTRISEEDLSKERKVVLEEWRESKNAQGRLFEDYIKALCKDCRWCERLPIGKEDVIKEVSAETLRNFYRRFYHPARMAVIAVGDFDGTAVTAKIQELFDIRPEDISPLPRAPEAPERPQHAVPDTPGIVVASSTDPELSFAQGLLDCKRPRKSFKTVHDYRRHLTEELFHKAFSSRLLKLTVEPRGPRNVFNVSTETSEPVPPLNPMSISVAPLPGRMRHALRSIIQEIERVKRMGFHKAELARAKRSILAEFEEEFIEREQSPSETFAEDFVGLVLDSQAAPGVEERARVAATVLPTVTHEEVIQVAKEFDFARNVVLKIATPPMSVRNPLYTFWSILGAAWHFGVPKPKMDLPDAAQVAELVRSVAAEHLDPWPEDEDEVETRLRRRFEACADRRRAGDGGDAGLARPARAVDAPGVARPERGKAFDMAPQNGNAGSMGEELVLQNGLRVFLKDTDLFDDEIIFRGRRWGGLSEHQESSGMFGGKGVVSCEAQTCSMSAMMLGICGLSVESLQECLDGRRVEPNPPSLEAYTTHIDCSASPADLEHLLMLLHLLFMCPVAPGETSRGRLSLVKFGLLAWRLGENRDPAAMFRRRVQKCITGDHPYTRLPSLWSILRLNFLRASAIFNERISMPREWTFVVVGRLTARDSLIPMLETYLGSIPNVGGGSVNNSVEGVAREVAARQAVTPLDINFPTRSVREEVWLQMVDPQGSTVLCFPMRLKAVATAGAVKSVEAELRDMFHLRLLVRLLQTRLVEVLRFKRGQVYGVSVADDFSLSPPHLGRNRTGTLSIAFECNPAESDELVQATQEELRRLRDGESEFTAGNVSAALEQERREFEEVFHKNDWWAETIMDLYFSRCQAVTGEIGASVALWWRSRKEVVASFDVAQALATFRSVLPADVTSAVIMMRPKGRRPTAPSEGRIRHAEDDGDGDLDDARREGGADDADDGARGAGAASETE